MLALGIAVGLPDSALSQSASELMAQGVAAYEDFDFPAAARLLERSLALGAPNDLSHGERLRALTYLGAAEHFSQHRSEAAGHFRSAVLLDTRYRPDSLFFPPEIIRLYDEALQTTKAVFVEVERVSAFIAGEGSLKATIVPSSFHEITVTIARSNGNIVRQLYAGPIREGLSVEWDGRGADRQPVSSGTYRLDVASRVTSDEVLRRFRVPLDVTASPADTLRHTNAPPDSLLAPERESGPKRVGPLVAGVALGAWAVMLPDLAGGDDASGTRYFVGAALSAASIYGFLRSGRGAPIPANVAANERMRAQWRERSAQIAADNARRRQAVELLVRAGPAERVEGHE